MGKSLIIKGADFSANGIDVVRKTWYITKGTDYLADKIPTPTKNADSGAWSFNDSVNALIQNKTINLIRFVPADAGEFKMFLLDERTDSLGSPVATINVASGDIGNLTEYEFTDVNVGAAQYLIFIDPSQAVRIYYASHSGNVFYKRCGFNNAATVTGYELLIDIGYKESGE